LDSAEFICLGPLFRDDPDPNLATRDRGANGLHGTLTAGVSYLGAKVDSAPALTVKHSGAGPLQFNGGPVFDTTKGWVIESLIVRASAAVGSWSLGNVSSGAQYVSGLALAAGDNRITEPNLITRLISGANLWSYASGAADITLIPKFARTF
jgi:hypothetical protein